MERDVPSWTLAELAKLFDGDLVGPSDLVVSRPIPVDGSHPQGLTFAESDDYLRQAAMGGAAAILAPRGANPVGKPTIFVDKPREAFGRFLGMVSRPLPLSTGIHPSAVVSPEATVATSAQIGPFAVIERGAVIGERCRIFPFAYVGENCRVGDETVLYPHSVLYQDVTIGARGIVHSGGVIGADGFGFAWTGERQQKIPQVGGVILGDDVEIGANSSVDRATAGDTVLGDDVKLDNLVQMAQFAAWGPYGDRLSVGDRRKQQNWGTCLDGGPSRGDGPRFRLRRRRARWPCGSHERHYGTGHIFRPSRPPACRSDADFNALHEAPRAI